MLRLLDLFCGAGGASVGYWQTGFRVVGVDTHPQSRYPFPFYQADALEFLVRHGSEFDVIHASPPCQAYSTLAHTYQPGRHVGSVEAVRDALIRTGKPYVIENVPGAPLRDPLVLCGSMFGLGCSGRQLRRHRLFESNKPLSVPRPCNHFRPSVGVYGHGGPAFRTDSRRGGYQGTAVERREAMGVYWMTQAELSQAIPPVYTRCIGKQLLTHLAG